MRIFLLLLLSVTLAHAAMIDALNADQKKQLQAGQPVSISTNIPGDVWPKITIYRIVNTPPASLWQLLSDPENAPSYTPGMLEAKIIAEPNPSTKDIQYTIKVPVLSKISYVVRNHYTVKASSYLVKWELVKSPVAKKSDGSIKVESYPQNRSLMCYTNLVVPSTSLVGFLKGQALEEALKTVNVITQEAEKRNSAANAGSTPNN